VSRKPCTFRQCEVTRAIKGMLAAGCEVAGAEIDPKTGKIVVMTSDRVSKSDSEASPASDFDSWKASKAKHNARAS
jgi:hypothetical protein